MQQFIIKSEDGKILLDLTEEINNDREFFDIVVDLQLMENEGRIKSWKDTFIYILMSGMEEGIKDLEEKHGSLVG